MGLGCSGEVSDASFYTMAEQPTIGNISWRNRRGLHLYYRFRDNIWFVCNDSDECMHSIVTDIQTHSTCFELKVEGWSSSSTTMLDARIYLEASSTSSFRCMYARKPTSIWRPLGSTSMHPMRIHQQWPLHELDRVSRRCTRLTDRQRCMRVFLRRFLNSSPHHIAVKAMQAHIRGITQIAGFSTSRVRDIVKPSWLVVPFHFAWSNAKLSRRFNVQATSPRRTLQVRISWKLGGPHLYRVLRAITSHLGGSRGR
eukprot:TRINITY_DN91113_c0_g1_i1.p1 TRINITY_DN91113_c0_g1~~TRINITY_DN91113_c0_g1_i1.p1  ORF type:complete len:291 (-),score=6.64 TRINITY_DN91113_c0_g1_i1:132-896(-)